MDGRITMQDLRLNLECLISTIAARHAKIGVVGLGYVGIPLALTAAKVGFNVLGFDVNAQRIEHLN